MKPLVVIDHNEYWGWNDALRDTETARNIPGNTVYSHLYRLGDESAITVMSADKFLDLKNSGSYRAVLISHGRSKWRQRLLERGCIPGVVHNTEPPFIDIPFYSDVPAAVHGYRDVWLWAGCRRLMGGQTSGIRDMIYPIDTLAPLPKTTSWADRKFAVLLNGAKFASRRLTEFTDALGDLTGGRKNGIKKILRRIAICCRHWMTFPIIENLYLERLRCLKIFKRYFEVDLIGSGWNQTGNIPRPWRPLVSECFRGEVPYSQKLDTLTLYQYALCFENSSLDGYVTEKIFDCFLAGTIPLYLGAPDIRKNVPENSFIDVKKFTNYRQLSGYLMNIQQSQAERIRDAGRAFLLSDACQKRIAKNVARTMFDSALSRLE